ncbi:MAG: hypothetical protein HY079_02110 [Elusimicrobia bacterium]|nr:hypothetical protein [Elusimicrobiota bacterium]
MNLVRLLLALACASVPAWAAPVVRVEPIAPQARLPAPFAGVPAVGLGPSLSPSLPVSLAAASPSLAVPSAPSAAPLRAAVPAAPALRAAAALPAPSDGPAAAPQVPAAPAPAKPEKELVELRMPNGKAITVSRGMMDERGRVTVPGSGPDGILIDLGPSEASFGLRAGSLLVRSGDWAFFSHDGRLTRLQKDRGGDRLVGGAARSVLIVAPGRARALGLKRGTVLPRLGEGSTVLEVRDVLLSGEWRPFDFAEAMKENPASEPRYMLDSLVASFDELVRAGGPEAARAAELRWEVLQAVAKHPRTDGHLRMQAATRMWLDGMPRALFRLNRDLPRKWRVAYQFADTWVHETGHQAVAWLVGSPLMEKRVTAHGAGFITTPTATTPRQLAIDAAGGAAEVSVGASAAALGGWALLGLHGWALAAAAAPALALILVGLHMAYSATAHAAHDLAHMFGLLGWTRAQAFMTEAVADSTRDGLALKKPGMTVPVGVFYRAAFRLLALKLHFRG